MAEIIKSVVEKTRQDGTKFWVVVVGNEEVPCYDAIIKTMEGKENPYEITVSGSGKKYLKVPKTGGFQGKSGGGWKGKSDKEIYKEALTMCLSYAKDITVSRIATISLDDLEHTLKLYRGFSKAVLADLKTLCPDVPVVDAPKEAPKQLIPQKAQERQSAPPPPDDSNLTPKQKLEKEMWRFLTNTHNDTDENFKTLLMDITSFPEKDKQTKELTGKMVFCDDFGRLSDKWAQSALGKLRELVDEEERKAAAQMSIDEDIPF